ncbi:MAG: hypothetical protein A2918_04055 [Candidatus Yanofskybacteria bacterium RIFCSPLOWO2_01_FULL_42_49]|uniref:Uncharacterized protein n=1 Tax=Candidatus Yanofskybacteria bacterium RIFCSPLOWO2_01_FULL_42_49 TaxID=1802694 RepID=A0A1F8GEM4_9BACT|nr:MAG: hypothetical protein A2918_04055 [Candidatus Yanofskybacteria bacterium RIFCSPLOWO2_01_FULL_42_49]
MFKKLLPIIIVLSLVFPSFVQIAQAGVLDSTIGFSSCAAAGFINNLIADGLKDLEDWAAEKLKGWIGIGSVVGGKTKVPVDDSDTQDKVDDFKGAYGGKEGAQDIIARCSAREILSAMGQNITNVARTGGRDGGPAWVRNWRNFQLDAQYRGEGIFRGVLASTNLCNYFGSDLKNLFGANQRIDLTKIRTRINDFDSFQVKAGCTLPSGFDIEKYKQDFSGNGGWEAWSRLLEPQNNFYGALFQSLDEAGKQRAAEEAADIAEAAPTGFTAVRGRNAAESCAIKSPADGRCLVYKDILTPSGILSGSVVAGIETELQWVATTDELNELIATGINVLVNRLWDLSNPDEGDYIVPGDLDVSISPFPSPAPPPSGGGGTCVDSGNTAANYDGDLQSAIDAVIANNPNGIADASNTTDNSFAFLDFVVQELQSAGFNATTNVLNGNDNPNTGDLIAIWRNTDSTIERYDAVSNAGAGDMSMRNAATVQYTGDIPLSCSQ